MLTTKLWQDVVEAAPNRRRFLNKLALGTAALAAMDGAASRALGQSSGPTDVDIINFALNLEYLEAEFYTMATSGLTIDQMGIGVTGSGTAGATTGGAKVNFGTNVVNTGAIANEIALHERTHVTFIRTALTGAGATPVARPAINLNALGIGFGGVTDFLQLARAFEDVGVSAYAGAAPLLQSKALLGYAARIAETESEHAANIRLQMAILGIPSAAVDGLDVLAPPSGTQYFSVDSNALTLPRTVGQVLYIVYGNKANATSGGFFPSGVNGMLNTSTTAGAPTTSNGLTAMVVPQTSTTNQAQIMLDASGSTSSGGNLTYLFMVAPGGLVPAVLQNANSPKATIQFVNGPGVYKLILMVKDGSHNPDGSPNISSIPVTLTYQP
jgi:hypothetical protein